MLINQTKSTLELDFIFVWRKACLVAFQMCLQQTPAVIYDYLSIVYNIYHVHIETSHFMSFPLHVVWCCCFVVGLSCWRIVSLIYLQYLMVVSSLYYHLIILSLYVKVWYSVLSVLVIILNITHFFVPVGAHVFAHAHSPRYVC